MDDQRRSQRLMELAGAEFGDALTDADRKLFRETANGRAANYGEGDPADAENWGDDRTLNADRIRWLCTDRDAIKDVLPHEGIEIVGAPHKR